MVSIDNVQNLKSRNYKVTCLLHGKCQQALPSTLGPNHNNFPRHWEAKQRGPSCRVPLTQERSKVTAQTLPLGICPRGRVCAAILEHSFMVGTLRIRPLLGFLSPREVLCAAPAVPRTCGIGAERREKMSLRRVDNREGASSLFMKKLLRRLTIHRFPDRSSHARDCHFLTNNC